MKYLPIKSHQDPNHPAPWAELTVSDHSLTIAIEKLNGFRAYRELAASRGHEKLNETTRQQLLERENTTPFTATLNLSSDLESPTNDLGEPVGLPPAEEVHVLAVTEDGEIVFVPESQQEPLYYAHLAWYNPGSGEWTVFQFLED